MLPRRLRQLDVLLLEIKVLELTRPSLPVHDFMDAKNLNVVTQAWQSKSSREAEKIKDGGNGRSACSTKFEQALCSSDDEVTICDQSTNYL